MHNLFPGHQRAIVVVNVAYLQSRFADERHPYYSPRQLVAVDCDALVCFARLARSNALIS